jgi:hypothetical protein
MSASGLSPRSQRTLHCSSLSIRLRYRLYGPGLETRQDKEIFLSSETSRPHRRYTDYDGVVESWELCDSLFHARQVKGDDYIKKGHPGPPDWRLGVRPTSHRKIVYVEKTSEISDFW